MGIARSMEDKTEDDGSAKNQELRRHAVMYPESDDHSLASMPAGLRILSEAGDLHATDLNLHTVRTLL